MIDGITLPADTPGHGAELKKEFMLDPKLNVAAYMEGHIDSDYGKMGMGVVRYLKNPIVGIVDSKFAGKNIYEIDEFNDINKDIKVYKNPKQLLNSALKF